MAAVALTIGEDNQFELTATTAAGVLHKIFRIEREELCLLDSPRPLTLENSTRLDELEAELSHANRELPELFYKLHECTARELGAAVPAGTSLHFVRDSWAAFEKLPVPTMLAVVQGVKDLVDAAAAAAPAAALLEHYPWCRRAFVVVSWALCWPGRLLDLFGQPIYTLFTAITVTWAWLSFVYCMLLAVLLDGSLSERLTWVVAGVGAAYGAAGVLVTYDVPARRERTAALQQRHKDALQMCKEWQSSECRGLQFYSGLAACAAEKLHLELVGPKA